MNGRFFIFKDISGRYRWRLKSNNNEIVASSEEYANKSLAVESAKKVFVWAHNAPIIDLTQ